MLDRIRRLIQNLTHWASQRVAGPLKTPTPLGPFCLDDSSGIPGVTSLKRAEKINCVERSPPDKTPRDTVSSSGPACDKGRSSVCGRGSTAAGFGPGNPV